VFKPEAHTLKTILISDIIIGDRQRKAFDENSLVALAESIATKNLLHPIVLHGKELVAGERRIRAAIILHSGFRKFFCDGQLVPEDTIPYIEVLRDTDAITLRETELEENLVREDITWQERVEALDELHKLRQAQNPKQTVSDTAREIKQVSEDTPGESPSIAHARKEVSRAKIIAPFLDDPEVRGASSAQRAFGIVAVKLEVEFTKELQRLGEKTASRHTLIEGDLVKEMIKLPNNTFTCIIADPPYGISADKFGDVSELSHHYRDDRGTAQNLVDVILEEGWRVAAKEAHIYIFCDIDLFIPIREKASALGWTPWRTPLIWDKGDGYAPQQSSGMKRCYELILWARKGDKPYGGAHKDIVAIPPLGQKVHAAQKPVELYSKLLCRSCLPGDKVLDPCCGVGTIFGAAVKDNFIATAIEIDEEFLFYARRRMNQEGYDDD
jgi:DNA modification methylase